MGKMTNKPEPKFLPPISYEFPLSYILMMQWHTRCLQGGGTILPRLGAFPIAYDSRDTNRWVISMVPVYVMAGRVSTDALV